MTDAKTCTRCGECKPTTEFTKDRSRKDGFARLGAFRDDPATLDRAVSYLGR